MFRILCTLTLFFAAVPAWAFDPTISFEKCLNEIQEEVESDTEKLKAVYKRWDPTNGTIAPNRESIFLRGQPGEGAVLLFHGIMSSPDDVRLLAEEFNRRGMTVLAPLIRGFGSSVAVENETTFLGWQRVVDKNYRLLSRCYEDMALVGFSLGGGLATDFVLNRYIKIRDTEKTAVLSSLVLLSPAIRPSESFIRLKYEFTKPFTNRVPFWLVHMITRDPDIKQAMDHPDGREQYFPIRVGINLLHLRDTLKKSPKFQGHELHVTLDYSECDKATDWEYTDKFLHRKFFHVETFSYKPEDKVPHTLHLAEIHPVGNEIRWGLGKFVEQRHKRFVEKSMDRLKAEIQIKQDPR
jgi:pimeloyl-ACP methyl ester carboxylesterase